jgi:hypothetical protein
MRNHSSDNFDSTTKTLCIENQTKLLRKMVFGVNNISVISWWSVLFVKETGVPGENHLRASIH